MTDDIEEEIHVKLKKKIVTVYVPVEIINEARARGINISKAASDGILLAIRGDMEYQKLFMNPDILKCPIKEDEKGTNDEESSDDEEHTEETP